jgi:glycosyltransferase involved in cell wall biosynthesis
MSSRNPFVVGLPIYNEEANLQALLGSLVDEPGLCRLIGVDDCSSDGSYAILRAAQAADDRVIALQNPERSGQLAAWLLAARTAETETIVFVDADAMPDRGAAAALVRAIENDPAVVAASGRVVPDRISGRWPPARFRSAVLHRVRALGQPKEAIIGRFFAVRREWFLRAVTRTDIIANDAYIGALATRAKLSVRYVPAAVCRYVEVHSAFDFAAQRQRADAGYAQLERLGILEASDGPGIASYVLAVVRECFADPIGGIAWIVLQVRARFLKAYRVSGRDRGSWEIQATTKRSIE